MKQAIFLIATELRPQLVYLVTKIRRLFVRVLRGAATIVSRRAIVVVHWVHGERVLVRLVRSMRSGLEQKAVLDYGQERGCFYGQWMDNG